jgi:hypothetical protein
MLRRSALLLACVGVVLTLAVLGAQKKPGLLLLDWAAQANPEATPVALLLEMGLKDENATPWPGKATVSGAKVVRREGYRFRDGDQLVEPDSWKATSRRPINVAGMPARARMVKVASVGVVFHLAELQEGATLNIEAGDNLKAEVAVKEVLNGHAKELWEGKALVRRLATATPLVTAKTDDDFPAAAYGPDGTLWLAYISYTLKEEQRRLPAPNLKEQPKDFKDFFTPEFGDQLLVVAHRNGRWTEPVAVTGPKEDLVRCAVGVEGSGQVWVAYSANRDGNYDVYARPIQGKDDPPKPGPEQRLTKTPGPDLTPVMCTAQDGSLVLACQWWDESGRAGIRVFTCRDGNWSAGPTAQLSASVGNYWYPAVAAGPDGKVAVAYDYYKDGDYDVHVQILDGGRSTEYTVAATPRFEARPSVAYDPQGRLWIAYEDGPEKWGKDFGALSPDRNSPLYNSRSVRVACLADGKLFRPVAELPVSNPPPAGGVNAQTPRYAYPKVGLDGKGRLWLTCREKLLTPQGVQPGTSWLTFARRLDGDRWSEPIEVHHSDGLLDSRPVLLPHPGGGLIVLTNTDSRHTKPLVLDNQIYLDVVDLPGEPVEPKLVAVEPAAKKPNQAEADELTAVKRLRDYRLEAGGKKYQLLRGEFHRHTEISFDGGNDGSLEDMFRYAIDVAHLDWIGNTDHDNGAGREYTWWLTQKYSDAYHAGDAFTPMFSYERSVAYPMGHRNVIFARRGVRTLPRLAEPDQDKRVGGVHPDDTKMLYRYLKELDGICASHTSATTMGTDWRDNDPALEPIVEIYQGDRNNYEKEEAPRAGHDPKSDKKPAAIGGWEPKGFINLAFDKGYRFGFQSSSDHISTHISFCVVLAEGPGREAILAALKKRHCYAATDDILVEVRSGNHLQGDEFKTDQAPALQIKVVGTKPLAKIEVLKDSDVVETLEPGKEEYTGTWTDPKPGKGVHWYYIRVQQSDGELAWSSPMWVEQGP